MKIAIIGAGSVYTPEIFEKLGEVKDYFPVEEVDLMDIDENRLDVLYGFCKRYSKNMGLDIKINKTTDLDKAVYGSTFINTQIRVGLNKCRVFDEKIPLSMNLVGQETTGAGGFAKALRTIPKMLEIAKSVEKNTNNSWIINYTNPTGIVTQALKKYSKANIVGLCSGGVQTRYLANWAYGLDHKSVSFDIAGLNHLSFSYNIKFDGRDITDEEYEKLASTMGCINVELVKKIGAIPSSYLQYFYHTAYKVGELQKAAQTRGEYVLDLEKDIYKEFSDENCVEKPKLLEQRGGGGYSDIAISVMNALYNNVDTWCVANVENNGVIKFLEDDDIVEVPAIANKSGISAITVPEPPKCTHGLIKSVKAYERLTVDAAVTGCRDTALLALTAHPLVNEYDKASELLPKILDAHKDYLDNFFKK